MELFFQHSFRGSYSLLLIIPGRAHMVCGPFVCFQSSALRRSSFVLFVTLLHQCTCMMLNNNNDDKNQICCYPSFFASRRSSFVLFVAFPQWCMIQKNDKLNLFSLVIFYFLHQGVLQLSF